MFEQGVGAVSHPGERALPQAKSLNTLVNHMARVRAQQAGEHEGLLVNRHGCLTEGSSSNLFVVQAGVLITPPVEDVLTGVTQEEVLKLAARLAIPVERRPLPLAELARWDEAFLTSTSRHVLPLVRLDGQPIGSGCPGSTAKALRAAFEAHFATIIHSPHVS
jgi:branched-subunit amino acid aminotransferase/4-amino-4-deoxychorismate lyase